MYRANPRISAKDALLFREFARQEITATLPGTKPLFQKASPATDVGTLSSAASGD